ncbi:MULTISPECIES: DUF3817 domain-containing protein [unclassified Corynebacterium]|uniref:DUF3817 domain-containing protein n=1 Tax=unclassified Corynebacterium TaxID=2624378 RepID=UPI0029CA985C|nr:MULTISPECIES: DUF3817 domain-containing protein [unclassified Corynebacterium]WPF65700.1 DUF3817 domain-containing protein [Corynebacterium sp. 22KM0430]WPF68196.1 DUF3817 domain-containing protein [Corynebacterium sp. 21KM1197]
MTQPSFQNTQPKIHPERQRRVRNALTFFSVSAWVTGVFLIALCVVMVLKYLTSADVPDAAKYVAIFHGWVYIVFVLSAFNLGLKARWEPKTWVITALCGVVPFLSFYVEKKRREETIERFQLNGPQPL